MALNLQRLTLRDAVGLACAKFGLVGSPVWDGAAWVDLSTVAAAWPGADAYPGDGRTCRVPTEAEVNAAAQDAAVAASAATTRAANKAKAQAFVAGVAAVRGVIDALRDDAATLETFVYSTTNATFRTQVQSHMNALGAKLGTLMDALDLMVDGEVFLGGEIIR